MSRQEEMEKRLKTIEQASIKLTQVTKASIGATLAWDTEAMREEMISLFTQLEVIKMHCQMLLNSKIWEELWA